MMTDGNDDDINIKEKAWARHLLTGFFPSSIKAFCQAN